MQFVSVLCVFCFRDSKINQELDGTSLEEVETPKVWDDDDYNKSIGSGLKKPEKNIKSRLDLNVDSNTRENIE